MEAVIRPALGATDQSVTANAHVAGGAFDDCGRADSRAGAVEVGEVSFLADSPRAGATDSLPHGPCWRWRHLWSNGLLP